MTKKIIENLKRINGLRNINLINEEEKTYIRLKESKKNIGVLECLKRNITLILTHNGSFRKPLGEIVIKKDKKIILPPVPFPEVKAKDVVSSSPSKKIHQYLVRKYNLKLKDKEATLIIGFN